MSSQMTGRVGRKKKDVDLEQMLDIPFKNRSSVRSLSAQLDVPIGRLHRMIKAGEILPHSNALKLLRQGRLPVSLECPPEVITHAERCLNEQQ